MGQITVRTDDELVDRVKAAARSSSRSMNEWVELVLNAATNPDFEGSEAERVRTRLRLAGLLLEEPRPELQRPDPGRVAAARKRAGEGTPLSDLVRGQR